MTKSLDDVRKKINPKVLGFTLYFCNSGPVDYVVKKLRKKFNKTIKK